jgi:chemotaxis protein MotB
MRRRQRKHESHNNERWVVSYADFITLLFAFFVVMYAISSLNEGKYRVLSNALQTAFGQAPGPPTPVAVVSSQPVVVMPAPRIDPAAARARRDERQLKDAADRLARALAPLAAKGIARVSLAPRGVVVEIGASALFQSAEAKLDATAVPQLQAVAAVLAELDNALQIEGHTDSLPIATPQFPSNWELSAARAAAVARVFIDAGVAAPRVAVLGHADTRPVEPNDHAEGRARNRRVQLLVLGREAAREAPSFMSGAAPLQ